MYNLLCCSSETPCKMIGYHREVTKLLNVDYAFYRMPTGTSSMPVVWREFLPQSNAILWSVTPNFTTEEEWAVNNEYLEIFLSTDQSVGLPILIIINLWPGNPHSEEENKAIVERERHSEFHHGRGMGRQQRVFGDFP
eukprot:TRINITY_DN5655_c0_g1_i3.p1 TRINITY_DN5655_c0_g1~~TRINITY_DN5655_c0_g1_i3.p1  ORF type:complete len:138 (+),score=11.84 TRINITY_DN5655_c0_g1_i3:156-569(+)